jgi:hypothetical protein
MFNYSKDKQMHRQSMAIPVVEFSREGYKSEDGNGQLTRFAFKIQGVPHYS